MSGVVVGEHMVIATKEIKAWATWLRAAARPQTTISLRTYHVRRVFKEIGKDPWSLSTEDLVTYLGSKAWAPETRRSYRSSLRAFYDWAQATGRRVDNPAKLLPSIRPPRGVPRPTPDRVYRDALLAAGERERLMIQLAAVCGLRRGEIAQVRTQDVAEDALGEWSLLVQGKGGHERFVPLPPDLAAQLRGLPLGWVFPSDKTSGPLTPPHVGKLVSRLLPEGWTCHTLGHRCATVAYASTRDLRAVQELLGHARTDTTARYTQIPLDAVRSAMRAASVA